MPEPRPSRAKPTATARGKAQTAKARAASAHKKNTELTERERRFAFHWMASARGNSAEAARLAGVPPKVAAKEGCRMLKIAKVQALIEAERRRRETKLQISADDVLIDLAFVREEARALLKENPVAGLKLILAATDKIGDHISVGAFRRQVGIGNPDGTPIEFNLSGFSTDEKTAFLEFLRRAVPALVDGGEAPSGA